MITIIIIAIVNISTNLAYDDKKFNNNQNDGKKIY
jgi:hypothetical protein